MKCSHCGSEIPDGAKTCSVCGNDLSFESNDLTKEFSEESTFLSSEMEDRNNKPHSFFKKKDPQQKKPKSKIFKVIKVILLLFVLFIVYALVDLYIWEKNTYEEAMAYFEEGDYASAEPLFAELESYKDSQEMEELCKNIPVYEQAQAYLDQGEYEKAKVTFESVSDYEDAYDKSIYCGNAMTYAKAESLMESGDYAAAKDLYKDLPVNDFPDALEKQEYCNNKEVYLNAAKLYEEGSYYEAYQVFERISAFDDAAERMQACIQPFPSTGATYQNSDYKSRAASLTIIPPQEDGNRNYIKIYAEDETLVCTIAIDLGKKATVHLPQGNYLIKTAYGSGSWFGEKDMFGDEGTYLTMTSVGEETYFDLEKGYDYTISLRIAEEDITGESIDSLPESRSDF